MVRSLDERDMLQSKQARDGRLLARVRRKWGKHVRRRTRDYRRGACAVPHAGCDGFSASGERAVAAAEFVQRAPTSSAATPTLAGRLPGTTSNTSARSHQSKFAATCVSRVCSAALTL